MIGYKKISAQYKILLIIKKYKKWIKKHENTQMKKNINTIISWGSGTLKLENTLKAMEFSSRYSNIWFLR